MCVEALEKQSKSGIIGSNSPKEIPEVSAKSVPMLSAEIPNLARPLLSSDVTEKYLADAIPGQGTITYDDGYKIKGHQSEIDMVKWLHRTFGGNITLPKESKEPGSKTPDFFWNGRSWELKGVTTLNSIDRAVREASKQIQDNPGGIILNLLDDSQTMEEVESIISQRFRRVNLDSVDILVVSEENLKKALRLKK